MATRVVYYLGANSLSDESHSFILTLGVASKRCVVASPGNVRVRIYFTRLTDRVGLQYREGVVLILTEPHLSFTVHLSKTLCHDTYTVIEVMSLRSSVGI